MARASRVYPALLLHINLLLVLFAGAMLATAARLKWDPSAYIPARELLPAEYRSAACVLPAAGLALLLLAHLALTALSCRPPTRRVLLVVVQNTLLS
ncbi:unnamed protein product [Danaus chrysippus]|uniref:(African queen) hypothetical protein n=1 Tax=Danaus chrysippus TaxID=151541 RepID=A0A8J2VQU8_9NEOP|nr:unnamed protein product [Danaus chrysippus]